ncbi:cell division protein PerM [Nocardia blacklockiae]|uniref:cell division protein PerM n=1 Tax=Nocardia blacklockiae TaxID=480036 RepID=UPI001894DA14|nr:DUF6350 family protein [Nocardia blacklockiae]MBF6172675.1 hypothetical protein [Nocardia blacklockiae]
MRTSPARWDGHREAAGAPTGRRGRAGRIPPEDNVFLSLSPERAKILLFIAARTASFTMVTVVVLVLLTLWAAGSGMTGASGAIAAGWLAVHQVPLVIGKTSLGLLPLLPTAVLLWSVARDCARAVEPDASRADLGWIVGAALAGPLLITAVCLAVAEDASAVVALQPPATLAAFGWVLGLHLVAAVAGIATRRNPLRDRLFSYLPEWVEPGARAALRAVGRLLLVALALTLISLLAHWSRIGETYHAAGNAAGVLGLTLLSVAYLPNVVLDVAGLLVGADVHIGTGGLSVFSVSGAPVPGLPILAAVPSGPAAGWWPALLLAPAVIGVLCGIDCARSSYDEIRAPWATLTAAGLSGLFAAVFGGVAGGRVGSFGYLGPDLLLSTVLTFAWPAVAGYAGLVCARRFLPEIAPGSGYVRTGGRGRSEGDYPDGDLPDGDYSGGEYPDGNYVADDYTAEDYAEDDYADDDYAADYETGYTDRHTDYDDRYRDADIVEGELVEEQPALSGRAAPTTAADESADILDAEVVEADLPEGRRTDGR